MPLMVARTKRSTRSGLVLIISSDVASPLKVERTDSAVSISRCALLKPAVLLSMSTSAGWVRLAGRVPQGGMARRGIFARAEGGGGGEKAGGRGVFFWKEGG